MAQGLFEQFPYTNFHNLNLDWILQKYKELIEEVNQINEWVAQHKIEYQDAIARLTAVENELYTFEDQIREEFDKLKQEQIDQLNKALEDMQKQLDDTLAEARAEIDEQITMLQNEVRKAITELENEFDALSTEIQNELNELKVYLNRKIIEINNVLTANNTYVFEYVEQRLDDFIREFPVLVDFPVYNPIRGETTNIQQCLYDLYDFARFYGLTAFQYDNLGLTASEYDDLELTATEYDQNAYKLLSFPDPDLYMLDPFTGKYSKIKVVIGELADLHRNALTATEYDSLELTADDYDAEEITAYDYDWRGKELLIA